MLSYRDLAAAGIPYCRPWLKTLMSAGKFPKPVKAVNGRLGWDKEAVASWLADRLAA